MLTFFRYGFLLSVFALIACSTHTHVHKRSPSAYEDPNPVKYEFAAVLKCDKGQHPTGVVTEYVFARPEAMRGYATVKAKENPHFEFFFQDNQFLVRFRINQEVHVIGSFLPTDTHPAPACSPYLEKWSTELVPVMDITTKQIDRECVRMGTKWERIDRNFLQFWFGQDLKLELVSTYPSMYFESQKACKGI